MGSSVRGVTAGSSGGRMSFHHSILGSSVIKSDIAIIHCTEGWVTPLHKALYNKKRSKQNS